MLTPLHPLNRHLERLFWAAAFPANAPSTGDLTVHATDNGWELRTQLPGVQPSMVDLQIEGDRLRLKATRTLTAPEGYRSVRRERRDTRFQHELKLPESVDREGISATAANGVLTVTLPRIPVAGPRTIPVTHA